MCALQFGNQLSCSVHQGNDSGDFFARHDHGEIDLFWGAHGINTALHGMIEDALIEEHQGIHGLVLGGWSDISVHSDVGKECLYFRLRWEEVAAGPHTVETDIAHEPV